MITIAQPRKIIGKESNELSDDVITQDVETAFLLKELFFDAIKKDKCTVNKKIVSSSYVKEGDNLHSSL